jgi:hypothetical protein
MGQKLFAAGVVVAAVTVIGSLSGAALGAQSTGGPQKHWTTPRTPWGEPDLQGTYSNRTITPFERPANVAGREFFTQQEIAALEKTASERSVDEGRQRGTTGDVGSAYNEFWWDRGRKVTTTRTSLVVDPADGRVPPLTPEAQKRNGAGGRGNRATGGADHWTDRSLFERCITRGMPGAMSPSAYNNNYRITQAPGVFVVAVEMLGGARVIPTDGRAHVNKAIRNWMGDSVGHWEGETLVVETTNFSNKTSYRGSGENLHLVERFTRVGQNEIDYRVTITDPTTFTKPWTIAIPYLNVGEEMYEYACHEGNYGMEGILAGGREEERQAAEAAAKGK